MTIIVHRSDHVFLQGCGASKSVQTQDAPAAAPTPASQKKVIVAAAATATTASIARPTSASNNTSAPVANNTNEDAIITEDSGNAQAAEHARPATPDLTLSGAAVKVTKSEQLRAMALAARDSGEEEVPDRDGSASSRDSGVVHERPSSRGGRAFDLTYDGQEQRKVLPARLEKLQRRSKQELSIDELTRKLEAAEARRVGYEQALKEKLAKEGAKVHVVQQAIGARQDATLDARKSEVADKENKALLNREASLKQLRDKLKMKEDHAKKVREAKRLSTGTSGSALATVNA